MVLSYRSARLLVKYTTKLIYDIDVIGHHNIPSSGPAIIAPNHESALETLLVPAHINKRFDITAVAMQEVWEGDGLFGRYVAAQMTRWGALPLDRKNPRVEQIKAIMHALCDGKVLLIFPEGHRMRGIQEFHELVGRLAYNNGVPVIPASIVGALDAQEHYMDLRNLAKGRPKITICYDLPMFCVGNGKDRRAAISEFTYDLQDTVRRNYEQYGGHS